MPQHMVSDRQIKAHFLCLIPSCNSSRCTSILEIFVVVYFSLFLEAVKQENEMMIMKLLILIMNFCGNIINNLLCVFLFMKN